MKIRRFLSVLLAVAVATAMIGGGVVLVEDTTDIELSPVEDAEASLLASYAAAVTVTFAASKAIDYLSEDTSAAQQKADAEETKLSIYASASSQAKNNDNMLTSFENSLNDSKNIARMEGKNAYIRALNNGSTKTQAEIQARNAIEEYYSVRQLTLINQWNITMTQAAHNEFIARNTSGLSYSYVSGGGWNWQSSNSAAIQDVTYSSDVHNMTLLNGSVTSTPAMQISPYRSPTVTFGLNNVMQDWRNNDDTYMEVKKSEIVVPAPTNEYSDLTYIDKQRYASVWSDIKQKEQTVQDNVNSFINGTYDAYQDGEINNSDLVDPYLAARDYSPKDDFGAWALRSYSAMGYGPPKNMQNIGGMTVESGNDTVSGILLSDGLPENGTFDVGTEYFTSNLSGTQFVINDTSGSMYEISGNFTVVSANTTDGGTLDSVEYQNISYSTADLDEFQSRMDQLDNLTAEINARQQKLRNSNGGLGLPSIPGVGGFGTLMIAILALLGVAVATND